MCDAENVQMVQRGMTFRPPPLRGIILMSQRPNAPYEDSIDKDGYIIYEGHDAPKSLSNPEPKRIDQPRTSGNRPTENGKFADWTDRYKTGQEAPARFHVYEKLRDGIWAFRGPFILRDYTFVPSGTRSVFKFVLQPITYEGDEEGRADPISDLHELQSRLIPTSVKVEVYARDKGRCVLCGATTELHFDHDLPYSKGGSSATAANVKLLCARHNLMKGARIE